MEQYEYDEIMDRISEKHNIVLDSFSRKALVLLHQRLFGKANIPFNVLCEQMVLEEMCNTLRPNMDLYSRVYALHSRN